MREPEGPEIGLLHQVVGLGGGEIERELDVDGEPRAHGFLGLGHPMATEEPNVVEGELVHGRIRQRPSTSCIE